MSAIRAAGVARMSASTASAHALATRNMLKPGAAHALLSIERWLSQLG